MKQNLTKILLPQAVDHHISKYYIMFLFDFFHWKTDAINWLLCNVMRVIQREMLAYP